MLKLLNRNEQCSPHRHLGNKRASLTLIYCCCVFKDLYYMPPMGHYCQIPAVLLQCLTLCQCKTEARYGQQEEERVEPHVAVCGYSSENSQMDAKSENV